MHLFCLDIVCHGLCDCVTLHMFFYSALNCFGIKHARYGFSMFKSCVRARVCIGDAFSVPVASLGDKVEPLQKATKGKIFYRYPICYYLLCNGSFFSYNSFLLCFSPFLLCCFLHSNAVTELRLM